MRLEPIAFVLLLVFSLVGVAMLATIFHELSHKEDFKDIATDGEVCVLTYPILSFNGKAGYYKFNISGEDREEYQRISKYTEFKAYAIDAGVWIAWAACLYFILDRRLNERYRNST